MTLNVNSTLTLQTKKDKNKQSIKQSKTIQKRIICLIVTWSREYITSIVTKGLVTNGGIDR